MKRQRRHTTRLRAIPCVHVCRKWTVRSCTSAWNPRRRAVVRSALHRDMCDIVKASKLCFCFSKVTNRGEVEDCAGNLSGMCRACTERISKFAQLLDWIQPGPEPLILGVQLFALKLP